MELIAFVVVVGPIVGLAILKAMARYREETAALNQRLLEATEYTPSVLPPLSHSEITERMLNDLRNAGASEGLIDAVRKSIIPESELEKTRQRWRDAHISELERRLQ